MADALLDIMTLKYVIGYANTEDGWRVGLFGDEEGERVPLFTFPLRGEITEERKIQISKALTEFVAACEQPDYISLQKYDQDNTTRN